MAFLAVKDIGTFIFNTEIERVELENRFIGKTYKSFLSNEENEAIRFAETSNIRGFNIDKNKNFIKDVKEIEKDNYAVKVSLITEQEFYAVFKSFPYLCTNKILKYNYISKQLDKDTNFGSDSQRVLEFENQIKKYQELTDLSKSTAVESYMMAFRSFFGFFPWKIMPGHKILRDSTRLKFGSICSDFKFVDDQLKQIDELLNIEIFHKDILEINSLSIGLQFHDEAIVQLIEAIEYAC